MGRLTDEERFWPKVSKAGACWLWTSSTFRSGYGAFRYDGQMRVAHRFAYELLVGRVPDHLQLDHLCRVRHCVNPEHLEAVPPQVNLLRGTGATAVNAAKTHCANGHEFTPENTYTVPPTDALPNGGRRCRACKRSNDRTHKARKAVAL